jgi:hypothetical protein
MRRMPKWMAKHPCSGCGAGYGQCAQGLKFSLKCCINCDHPGRWVDEPYTAEEIAEMKARAEG